MEQFLIDSAKKNMTNAEIEKKIERLEEELKNVKGSPCEIYARSVGYFRPVKHWNPGKQEEFKERRMFDTKKFKKEK